MAEELFIPKLGQTVEEVTLIKWLVKDGTQVEQGQEILEVETDKAVFPVEAPASGTLHLGPYKEGEVVPVLTVVGIIGAADDKFEPGEAEQAEPSGQADDHPSTPETTQVTTPTPARQKTDRIFASPRARKLATEKGVDLAQVTQTGGGGVRVAVRDVLAYLRQLTKATPLAQKMAAEAGLDLRQLEGSGPGGKILKEDVERTLAAPQVPTSAPAPLSAAEVLERVPLTGVRGTIARRMAASDEATARVTLVTEVDATSFVEVRERLKTSVADEWGFAPGYNDLLGIIVARALREFPYMNARLSENGEAILRLSPVNLGMAVDTERGLLVPVIRDADQKGLRAFGTEFRALVERAQAGRATPEDLTGGTFTITNLGMYEIDAFTPIINLPEVAILGVGRIQPKPVVREGEIVVRQMWTLSLAFDHRLVDGAPAARFLQRIKLLVETPYLLLG